MIRYNQEPRTTEQEVLALDSIYGFLTAHERLLLHLSHNKLAAETSLQIWKLMGWVEQTNWKTPFMKYPEFDKDQLYFEDEDGELRSVKEYAELHPEITEQIQNIITNDF